MEMVFVAIQGYPCTCMYMDSLTDPFPSGKDRASTEYLTRRTFAADLRAYAAGDLVRGVPEEGGPRQAILDFSAPSSRTPGRMACLSRSGFPWEYDKSFTGHDRGGWKIQDRGGGLEWEGDPSLGRRGALCYNL